MDMEMDMEVYTVFSLDEIETHLKKENLAIAMVETATIFEGMLAELLKNKLDIGYEVFEKILGGKSLGKYYELCKKFDLIGEEEYKHPMNEFINRRNDFFHNHSYWKKIQENEEERKNLVKSIENVLEVMRTMNEPFGRENL